jgi:hypothetical protein
LLKGAVATWTRVAALVHPVALLGRCKCGRWAGSAVTHASPHPHSPRGDAPCAKCLAGTWRYVQFHPRRCHDSTRCPPTHCTHRVGWWQIGGGGGGRHLSCRNPYLGPLRLDGCCKDSLLQAFIRTPTNEWLSYAKKEMSTCVRWGLLTQAREVLRVAFKECMFVCGHSPLYVCRAL